MDKPSCPSFEQIVKDLIIRDERDKTRKIAPLKQADDAIVIDNSDLTEEETLEKCLGLIKEKLQK
jgi:cytidylate kinase